MRIHPVGTPAEEWGRLTEGVARDRKFGASLNMFADSARIEGSISLMKQCCLHWPTRRETGYAEPL
jgi:hypothetical protein